MQGMCGSGAEGKLAGMTQKLCLVTAIANLAHNSVSGTSSIESLAAAVVDMFISMLQNEGLSQFSSLIQYYTNISFYRWPANVVYVGSTVTMYKTQLPRVYCAYQTLPCEVGIHE